MQKRESERKRERERKQIFHLQVREKDIERKKG